MFNKLKQTKDLIMQAKKIKDMMESEVIAKEKDGIKVALNGSFELVGLSIPENMGQNVEKLAKIIKELHADCLKEIQKNLASKMMSQGGGIQEMLSKLGQQ
jgi:hypothetical protein